MKPRHAAALALVGWYLMIPPINRTTGQAETFAPLSSGLWTMVEAYDTAEACEKSKRIMMDIVSHPDKHKDLDKDIEKARSMAPFVKCIATDDPRLKGN
jgi:hypothetical protein